MRRAAFPRAQDKALMHVGCLPGLLSLNVSGCAGITNAGLALLAAGAATQELLKLDVRGTGVTAEGLGAVARVRQVFHESRAPPKVRRHQMSAACLHVVRAPLARGDCMM